MNRSVLSPLRASRRSGAVPIRAVLCYVGRACAAATLALLVSSPVSADEPPFTLAEAQRVALLRSKRSEEHTSELQSHSDLVCRLLLEKKKYVDPLSLLQVTLLQRSHAASPEAS